MIIKEICKNCHGHRDRIVLLFRSNTRQLSGTTTVGQSHDQLKVFRDNSSKWWSGKEFSILRSMNEIRVPFITNGLNKPLDECKIMDVGCGGGILSESLARLGANVYGIDPVFESINQAQIHAQTDEALKDRLKYSCCNIEDLSNQKEHYEAYDALVASEVLEHIEDVENFLKHCTKVIKPNGSLFLTTINQTPLSWLGVIFFGEYILQQLPKGTHTYDMFVSVKGLRIMLERMGYHIRLINGFMYEPLGGKFYWTPTTLTHYAIQAIKKAPIMSESLNHQQRRYLTTTRQLSAKNRLKLTRPKVLLDRDELKSVVAYDIYEEKVDSIISELKNCFENDLITRAQLNSIEKLKIPLEGLNEPLELRDIAQINFKGNNLIIIDLSTTLEAVKPTMKALMELGHSNAQVEVNNIFVPIPRVTREHREKMVGVAQQTARKSIDKLKALFSDFSSKAKRSTNSGVSEDLARQTVENLQFDMHKRIQIIDEMLKKKEKQLLNEQK